MLAQTASITEEVLAAGSTHRYGRLVENGTAVGHLWYSLDGGGDHLVDGYIWEVAVDPPHRGRGLGRAAVLLAVELAAADGATGLALSVELTNTVARRLYASLGFVEDGPPHHGLQPLRRG